MEHPRTPIHDRRTFLVGIAALLATACSDSDNQDNPNAASSTSSIPTTTDGSEAAANEATGAQDPGVDSDDGAPLEPLTPATFTALSVCTLTPSATAGPFPSIEQLDRSDITEGYAGHPLRLGIRVVDDRCQPIPGAQVEIWHTDATGDYSSYEDNGSGKDEGDGTTFLRGLQTADDDGILEFQTIYPGWYEGRAVHIHATVLVDGANALTTQLYFDEAYTTEVYTTGEYAQFGPPDTPWANDRLIGDPTTDGSGITLAPAATSLGDGTLGLVHLGVPV
ncbi:MAG: hypothetical protein ACR2QE_03190 [Acidimicrobiales bacterium]